MKSEEKCFVIADPSVSQDHQTVDKGSHDYYKAREQKGAEKSL